MSLGVLNSAIALFENIGSGNFIFLYTETFEFPTHEFLASMIHDKDDKTTQFQTFVQSFFSFKNVKTIMRTPRKGTHFCTMPYPDEFE